MANQVIVPRPPGFFGSDVPVFRLLPEAQQPLWKSLFQNVKEALFPEKLPPLRLTSRPVTVREIWSRGNKRQAAAGSLTIHVMAIAAIITLTLIATRAPQMDKPKEQVTLIAPPLSDYQPVMQPKVAQKQLAGGGGGGDHAKIFESKGHLPKVAPEQFTPPTVEIRNEKPKLAMEATVVAPPNVKLPDNPNMPNLGNPMSARVSGPVSNGPGSGGGIGTGNRGGIGPGSGGGFGPGQGGGFGGGVYRVGEIGVSAPVPKFVPDPDYSEEARKAKYQGTITLYAIIGTDGRPRSLKVVHGLGMGLDEKAMEKVRTWLFEPGKKDGQAVAVAMNIVVDFHLY
ncbi:MAG TPA: energy transducer TonB [Candidatus Angelobacter sp.]